MALVLEYHSKHNSRALLLKIGTESHTLPTAQKLKVIHHWVDDVIWFQVGDEVSEPNKRGPNVELSMHSDESQHRTPHSIR